MQTQGTDPGASRSLLLIAIAASVIIDKVDEKKKTPTFWGLWFQDASADQLICSSAFGRKAVIAFHLGYLPSRQ